jgi:hypothetical protein
MALTTMTDIANSNKVDHEWEIACKRKEMSTRLQWLLVTLWSTFDLHRTLSRLFDTDRHRELKNVTHETRTRHSIWTERDNNATPTVTRSHFQPRLTCVWHCRHCPTSADIANFKMSATKLELENNFWTERVIAMRLQRLLATFSMTLDLHVGHWLTSQTPNIAHETGTRNSFWTKRESVTLHIFTRVRFFTIGIVRHWQTSQTP